MGVRLIFNPEGEIASLEGDHPVDALYVMLLMGKHPPLTAKEWEDRKLDYEAQLDEFYGGSGPYEPEPTE